MPGAGCAAILKCAGQPLNGESRKAARRMVEGYARDGQVIDSAVRSAVYLRRDGGVPGEPVTRT